MQKFAYNTFGSLRQLGQAVADLMTQHENDPPKRAMVLAPASILVLMMSFLVFPGLFREGVRLGFGRTAAGVARSTARSTVAAGGTAGGGASPAAARVTTVAIVATVMVVVMIAILILIAIRVCTPAEPGPRMAIVFAGKGRG
jgi:hypothetical protein